MKNYPRKCVLTAVVWCLTLTLVLMMGWNSEADAQQFSLNVQDQSGAPVNGFRWLLQEDTTYEIIYGITDDLAKNFHKSYAPVVSKGETNGSSVNIAIPDPNKRYFVSVLPSSGHTMSGAPVAGNNVTVIVHKHPIPTAQISIFVFEDNFPINNAPDLPEELGLAGFKVRIEDAGGLYGITAGAQMMDAFGNPIGTVYDQKGNILVMGDGVVTTDANGEALIQNLAPGKYGITVVPPLGEGWVQTSTIEGKKVIDAWVKANEPPFFVEFGPPGYHVFIGFTKEFSDHDFFSGSSTISGRIVNLHNARPPNFAFWPGHPFPGAWVGLNEGPGGTGRGVYAAPCNEDSTFEINNVPAGLYQLVVWDENLDIIFAFKDVIVPEGGVPVILGDIPVFAWFGRLENIVFEDYNLNGFRDPNEPGIPEQVVNIRFRNGAVYQSMPTDLEGASPFEEVFPFFNWLVAEVDFTRYRATGVTVIVDDGGKVLPDNGWDYPSRDVLTPQPQFEEDGVTESINPNTGNNLSRTETGPVLTQAFQVFLGQTNVIEWGKAPYGSGQNGGISGIVHYATTRAENDPMLAFGEPWEPGIPRVQVNLYEDLNGDKIIDDKNIDSMVTLADVDNYPFQWTGQGDILHPDYTGLPGIEDIDRNSNNIWDMGDAIQVVWTDSWDDNTPTGAQGSNGPGFEDLDAFDGLRNFNQVRPGVFDGGYAFNDIPAGIYIVEAITPPGYEHVKEENKNVDFGDEYVGTFNPIDRNPVEGPEFWAIPVGDLRVVPAELSLFPGIPAPYAGELRALPDRKQVKLSNGLNSACNFFMFTEVPVASQIVGIILDDLANEFDPNAPAFGEKYSPPWIPISVRDWAGNVISWSSSDKYGAYNILVPSTYTANLPQPSGMSPNMLTVVLNDPGHPTVPPHPHYSQFSYTFQYMPGTTTYLDTPVVPLAAFAGPGQFPVDTEFADGTPVIKQVDNGPYVASVGSSITIQSMGTAVPVLNPDYDGTNDKTIMRDYGFGSMEGIASIGGVPITVTNWNANTITGIVANGTETGQLVITKADGTSSILGVTVTVGGPTPIRVPNDYATIQDAIDFANPGDLILVAPGIYYELVIMYKPVKLQGWGAGSTFINAVQAPSEKILNWRNDVESLWNSGAFDLLPSQEINFTGIEPALAMTEGAGISVFAPNTNEANGGFGQNSSPRIDGLTIEGASTGGGIFVNGYAHYLEISNSRIRQNSAFQGGGINIGHPTLTLETAGVLDYQNAENDHISIHNNQITSNGSLGGAGGGVSLYTGTDYYEVKNNLIAGNFSMGDAGGIGHLGRSSVSTIAHNQILFNQSFNQGTPVSGGGILIGGNAPLAGTLTPGSGSVNIDSNIIQGNLAGAGDGGGIRIQSSLIGDVINIINNIIVNNVTGLAGVISLQDAATVNILHNTIAHNDSTATAGEAFMLNPNQSTPHPAGIVSREFSSAFKTYTGNDYSAPTIDSNIIWENRSFYFWIDTPDPGDPVALRSFGLLPDPATPVFWDLGVLPQALGSLTPINCILTGGADPGFIAPYFNGPKDPTILQLEFTTIQAQPAFDEGGNFIDVRFGPLTIEGNNYHVGTTINGGTSGLTATDIDGDLGNGASYIGADLYIVSDNGMPIAVNDSYYINLPDVGNPAPLVVNAPGILANDFDPDGDALTVILLTNPSIGTLLLNADGSFTYTLGSRFEGTVSFSYLASDGSRGSIANVNITIRSVPDNEPPVPTAMNIITQINTLGTTRIMPNDPNVGDTHTYNILVNPMHGVASVSSGGTVSYKPNKNYLGADSLMVRVVDQNNLGGNVLIEVTVTLSLAPTQDIVVQMPPDMDGIDTDGDGDPDNDNVYILLGAGDGFSTMADGYEQYIFSFRDLSHLLPNGMMHPEMSPSYMMPPVGGDPAGMKAIPLGMVMHHGMLGAEWPAPTIKVKEGQKVYLNLVNVGMMMRPDLFDPHTVHWHGFSEAAPVFDGVPDSSISVAMGGVFTYFYDVVWPGTYMYHCHVEATEHMQMGMLGNLYVTPMQDNNVALYPKADSTLYKGFAYNDGDGSTGYDVDYPIQLAGFDSNFHDASINVQPLPFALMKDNYPMINGRGYPDTLESGSLPPASSNIRVETATILNSPAPKKISFSVSGNMLATENGAYNGLDLVFTSGVLKGQSRMIQDYIVKSRSPIDRTFLRVDSNIRIEIVLMHELPEAPSAGDTFTIGKASQNVSSKIEVTKGQRLLLRLSNLDVTRFYTLASTIPMQIVGLDARLLRGPDPDGAGPEVGRNLYYMTRSITMGGGQAADAIIDTTDVAPGTYLLYTTNLNYLSNNQEDFGGMMTEIVVKP